MLSFLAGTTWLTAGISGEDVHASGVLKGTEALTKAMDKNLRFAPHPFCGSCLPFHLLADNLQMNAGIRVSELCGHGEGQLSRLQLLLHHARIAQAVMVLHVIRLQARGKSKRGLGGGVVLDEVLAAANIKGLLGPEVFRLLAARKANCPKAPKGQTPKLGEALSSA